MTDVQSALSPVQTSTIDAFEDGWDCGVDWANEHIDERKLAAIIKLYLDRSYDPEMLLMTLGKDSGNVFPLTTSITGRHVEGFLDGVAAILRADH